MDKLSLASSPDVARECKSTVGVILGPLNSVPRQRVRSVQATLGYLGKVEMMLIGTTLTLAWEL